MLKFFIIFSLFVTTSVAVWGQDKEDAGLDTEELQSKDFLERVKKLQPTRFTDLVHLSPFSDVSVIQRRFMPKTGRMAVSITSNFALSSEFLLHPGAEAHLSYHFLEKHGVELSAYHVFSFDRKITGDLKPIGVSVSEKTPVAQSFVGLAYKWMPIYGKMAFFNKKILAFDTFFSIGGGMSAITTNTLRKGQMVWEPTAMVGVGQVFAFTRNFGMRWDLRWHIAFQTQADLKSNMAMLNNFILSVGFSYYYPSAGVR